MKKKYNITIFFNDDGLSFNEIMCNYIKTLLEVDFINDFECAILNEDVILNQ